VAYGVLFQIVKALVFGPLVAVVLSTLIATAGQRSFTNTDIAGFLLSVPGLFTLVAAGTAALVLLFAEQAGLIMIGFAAEQGYRLKPPVALRLVLAKLPRILSVALAQVIIVVSGALPFLGLAALVYLLLLSGHDINYYLAEKPPIFIFALMIGMLLLLVMGILLALLYVRWAVALPLCLFEGKSGWAALRGSRTLVRGYFQPIALLLLGWAAFVALVSFIAFWVVDRTGMMVLRGVSGNADLMISTAGMLMVLWIVQAALLSFIGMTGHSLLVMRLYENLSQMGTRLPPLASELAGENSVSSINRQWRWSRVWIAAGLFGVITTGGTYAMIENLELNDRVAVTAHRGSSLHAPENTLSAVKRAIQDGADYAEIDVQETADGTVVVIHDSDLMRIAGLDKKIWEVTYDEIRELDVGSWFAPEFKGESIPTLQQLIDLADDKIKLNIELKFNGHDERLVERVVEIIADNRFEDRCVVSSLDYGALLQVKRLNGALPVGHIVSVAVGDVTKLQADFLSVETKQVTETLLRSARKEGMGVHVWTVNDPNTMVSMIEKGVQNIITDKPGVLVDILKERSKLSDSERVLLKFGHWKGEN
jgi:glycerophosphoryl diester phosphodiesterase